MGQNFELGPPECGGIVAHFMPENIWLGSFDRVMENFSATGPQNRKKRAISEKKSNF
jgi:hypothetical protein